MTNSSDRTTDTALRSRYDVVVVGGGAAGLSVALTLSRARRSVLVIDAGDLRNAPAAHEHGFLSRDGMPPNELLETGRADVRSYGGQIMTGTVVAAEALPDSGFHVRLAGGSTFDGLRLLFATGLRDELPDVPGVAERLGRDAALPVLPRVGSSRSADRVLATGPCGVHQALMWRQWTESVTLFPHSGPEPSDAEYEQLAARGIAMVDGPVEGLQVDDDRLTGVRLSDAHVIPCAEIVAGPSFTARADVLATVGLATTAQVMGDTAIGTSSRQIRWGNQGPGGMGRRQCLERARSGRERGGRGSSRGRCRQCRPDGRASSRSRSGPATRARHERRQGSRPERPWISGAGEGADAIWLAQHATAVGDRVDWQQHDLARSFPAGAFDLVSAQFLHSPLELPRRHKFSIRSRST